MSPLPLLRFVRGSCVVVTTVMCAKQRQCNHPWTWTLPPAAFLGEEKKKRTKSSRTVCCGVPERACKRWSDRELSTRHCESTRDVQPGRNKPTPRQEIFIWSAHVRLFFFSPLLSLAFATGKILSFPQNFHVCFAEWCEWRGK